METETHRFLRCSVCGWISKKHILPHHTPNLKICMCPVCHEKKLPANTLVIDNIEVAKCVICGIDSTETTIRTLDDKTLCSRCIKKQFG